MLFVTVFLGTAPAQMRVIGICQAISSETGRQTRCQDLARGVAMQLLECEGTTDSAKKCCPDLVGKKTVLTAVHRNLLVKALWAARQKISRFQPIRHESRVLRKLMNKGRLVLRLLDADQRDP
jgi:hypothetical protein